MLDHNMLVRRAYQLQPLPQSCTRLAGLLTHADTDLEEISDVISFDPVLTGKLLRIANSVATSSRRTVATVKDAVLRLGSGTVLSLAVGGCAQPMLEQAVPGYAISARQLWRHSVTAALAAEAAKSICKAPLSPLSFTAALLHDIGKLVLGQFLKPDVLTLYNKAIAAGLSPYQAEVEILSVHHGEVGGLIAQHWNLPLDIVQGITHHHTPDQGEDPVCFVTHLADAVAKRIEGQPGQSDAEDGMQKGTWERLELTAASFEKVCEETTRRLGEVSRRFH